MSLSVLPTVNAILNAITGILIVTGYVLIRRKQMALHRFCMIGAVTTSSLFLVSYIVYHYNHGATRFLGLGIARPIYFTVLFSHTVLAVITAPLVIITIRRAMRGQFGRHLKIAKYTFPMWLYVSVTGIVVYLMLYHLYPSR